MARLMAHKNVLAPITLIERFSKNGSLSLIARFDIIEKTSWSPRHCIVGFPTRRLPDVFGPIQPRMSPDPCCNARIKPETFRTVPNL